MRWDRAEPSNYNNPLAFAQNGNQWFCAAPFPFPPSSSARELTAGHAIHDRQRTVICAKPIRDLAIVAHVKYSQVGVFARFHAAFAAGEAKRPGSVDGGRCDCLRR